MRALLLVAALVLSGCNGEGPPGQPVDALTIGFLPTDSLPTDRLIAYSTGVAVSCRVGGYLAFRADVRADADTSSVRLAIAKVDADGNQTAVGSPPSLTVVASEPPPTGLKTVIFKPLATSELCATLSVGAYHAWIVAPDGTALTDGRFIITP
jgi:hypothetical protein